MADSLHPRTAGRKRQRDKTDVDPGDRSHSKPRIAEDSNDRKKGDEKTGVGDGADNVGTGNGDGNINVEINVEDGGENLEAEKGGDGIDAEFDAMGESLRKMVIESKEKREKQGRETGQWVKRDVKARRSRRCICGSRMGLRETKCNECGTVNFMYEIAV